MGVLCQFRVGNVCECNALPGREQPGGSDGQCESNELRTGLTGKKTYFIYTFLYYLVNEENIE